MDDIIEWKLYTECPISPNYINIENVGHKKVRSMKKSETCLSFEFLPKRFIFAFIGFLASTLAVSLNTNLSMAIVSMVDRSNETFMPAQSLNECHIKNTSLQSIKSPSKSGEFHWSPDTEGLALGAVYYGQLLGFLPSGRMAELLGGKRTLLGFFACASFFTILSPLAARISIVAFIACRLLIGIGTAPVIPVLFYMISRWIPEAERSFNASFVLAGYGVGAFLSFLSAGILCELDLFGGWPAVFYFGGLCGFSWCILCYIFIYETPKDHPSITKKELNYIQSNLGKTEQKQIKKIPWKSILTSVPFWSLVFGYFGQFWILGFYCTVQALYTGTILNMDSKTNGVVSSLPPLIRGIFACICGYPADLALKKGYVTKGFIRKAATISNSVVSCVGFGAILMAGCDPVLNAVFFTVGALLGDFVTFGVCMAGVDLAPNLSGTISGILSFAGVIPFFAIPALVGLITKYERSMYQWQFIFYGSIVVVILSTFAYAFLGTSEPQSWGVHNLDDEVNEDNEDRAKLRKNDT